MSITMTNKDRLRKQLDEQLNDSKEQKMKTFSEKAYDKWQMAKRNHEELNLMLAESQSGEKAIVLMVGIIPIAKILQDEEILNLNPNFQVSGLLGPMWKEAARIDTRKEMKDFSQWNPKVTEIIEKYLDKHLPQERK